MNRLLNDDKVKSGNDFNFNLPDYNFAVDLPSKGLYYSDTHPLHNKEYVELKHVTGKEEAILTNRDHIKKGIVLDKFLQALFVDRSLIFPDIYNEILLGDKFALLIAARNSAYSNEYKAQVKCPSCEEEVVFSFDLSKTVLRSGYNDLGEKDKVKFSQLKSNIFRFKLPASQLNISIKLFSNKEESNIMSKSRKLNKNDSLSFKDQFIDLLIEIEGNSSIEAKEYFLDNVPAIDLLFIRTETEKLNPETKLEQTFKCPKCEHEEKEFEVPITQNFLFPHLKLSKY